MKKVTAILFLFDINNETMSLNQPYQFPNIKEDV